MLTCQFYPIGLLLLFWCGLNIELLHSPDGLLVLCFCKQVLAKTARPPSFLLGKGSLFEYIRLKRKWSE